jgi:hypothetical protein
MNREEAIKKLADLIEAHPICHFNIDNDAWWIEDAKGREIVNDGKYVWDTEWYSHSSNYGCGLSEVLLELLKRRGLLITASAV